MSTERESRKRTPFIRALLGASWVVVAGMVARPEKCYTIGGVSSGIYVSRR